MPDQKQLQEESTGFYEGDPEWEEFLRRAEETQAGLEPGHTASEPPEDVALKEAAKAQARVTPDDPVGGLLAARGRWTEADLASLADEFDLDAEGLAMLRGEE